MSEVKKTGIEVIPTTREQVTKVNASNNRIEFDRSGFRRSAEINRDRYIKSVESQRKKIAMRERD